MTREERNEYARKRYHSPVGQAYVKKRKESIRAYQKQYYAEHAVKLNARMKLYRVEHADELRLWFAQNHQKKKDSVRYRAVRNEATRRHRMQQRRAMPQWANLDRILEVYERAQAWTEATGIRFSVDHIIPLQHPLVCGLHVDYNMQVIPWIENRRKGNRINLNTKV
jgi:hypothetical protein